MRARLALRRSHAVIFLIKRIFYKLPRAVTATKHLDVSSRCFGETRHFVFVVNFTFGSVALPWNAKCFTSAAVLVFWPQHGPDHPGEALSCGNLSKKSLPFVLDLTGRAIIFKFCTRMQQLMIRLWGGDYLILLCVVDYFQYVENVIRLGFGMTSRAVLFGWLKP